MVKNIYMRQQVKNILKNGHEGRLFLKFLYVFELQCNSLASRLKLLRDVSEFGEFWTQKFGTQIWMKNDTQLVSMI
jgi:hypothetical protein